jgi:hypothetical protein
MRLFQFLRRQPVPEVFELPSPAIGAIRLRYPISPAPRVAVFGFRCTDTPSAQTFAVDDAAGLSRFGPQAFAASLGVFRRLLAPGNLAGGVRSGLDAPLIVFSDLANGLMTDEDRDWLWNETGLPVYEQWRGFGGELLAWECEARDGFHFDPREARFETSSPDPGDQLLLTTFNGSDCSIHQLPIGYSGLLDTRTCDCGSSLPRAASLAAVIPRRKSLAIAV